MNKQELVSAIADKTEMSKAAAEKALVATFDTIKEAIIAGDGVQLIGFGSWTVKERAARSGRNPQTGEPMKIAAKKVVTFSTGKAVKDALNVKKAPKKAPAKKSPAMPKKGCKK